MNLTFEQKFRLYRDGYVVIPGVVPRVMVDAAVKAINHSMGEGIDPAQLPSFRGRTYCPEIHCEPVIADLYNQTAAKPLVESLIGEGQIKRVAGGQIALRFPSFVDPPRPPGPHLDGMYSPTNGNPPDRILSFTALAGLYLSEVPEPYCGNFTVWPGSHRLYEQYFQEHGPLSLLNGMPPVSLPPPVQVCGKPGDLILAHYLLGHSAAMNVSPNTRYAIFFRLAHVGHDAVQHESMADMWREWPEMQPHLEEFEARLANV